MKKTISAGVIIKNKHNQILRCKPFGKSDGRCDIPKGQIEDGETPLQAAIRETFEETGIDLNGIDLVEIGFRKYQPNKDLHLFTCHYEVDDLSVLKCTSLFKYNDCLFPEVDGYEWIDINPIIMDRRFNRSLCPILRDLFKNSN